METSRLRLRPLKPEDVDDFQRLCVAPGVRRYLWDDQVIPRERAASVVAESVELFEKDGSGLWAVSLVEDGALVGFCGFMFFHDPPRLQLLYAVAPEHWGRGFATEAARAMIRYGFERLGLRRVEASADAPNAASLRVLEKAGMKFERRECLHGLETVFYSIAREDFRVEDTPNPFTHV